MKKRKWGLLTLLVLLACLMVPMSALAAKKGWALEKGNWYYYNNGKKVTSKMITDKGNKFYLKSNGTMATGWLQINKKWYFFNNAKSPQGAMAKGWVTTGGVKYYLDKNTGVMYTGRKKIGSATYIFKSNGALVCKVTKPSWKSNSTGIWYDNGDGTWPSNGWKTISGKKYYFNKSGYVVKGWFKYKSNYYYLGNDGAMYTKKWITINAKSYYLKSNGVMATYTWVDKKYVGADGVWIKDYQTTPSKNSGWTGNDIVVRKNNDNSAAVNWRYYSNGFGATGFRTIEQKMYFFENDGYMRIGWLTYGGHKYYLNTQRTGVIGQMLTGWQKIDGKHYYFYSDTSKYGKMARNTTLKASNNKTYKFDANGVCTNF